MTARELAGVGAFLVLLVALVVAGVHQVDVARTEDHTAAIAAWPRAPGLTRMHQAAPEGTTALNAEVSR